jgi:hypothetical protein
MLLDLAQKKNATHGPEAVPGRYLSVSRRNIKGRPFWSRVWVLASIPTERNALNG